MMDIFNMLGGMGGAQQRVSQQLGTNPQQTASALEAAVPLLLGAMTRNAAQPGGLDALSGALNRHDGSALDAFQAGQMPNMQDGQKILGHVFGGQQQAAANAISQRSGISPQMAMQLLMMVAPLILGYLSRQRQGGMGGRGGMGGQGQMGGDLGSILGGLLGGGAAGGLGGMLGGMLGGQGQQAGYPQTGYPQTQQGGAMFPGFPGGAQAGGSPTQGSQMGQGGDLLSTLNRTLDRDGDGNALDDLIGMFGGRRA